MFGKMVSQALRNTIHVKPKQPASLTEKAYIDFFGLNDKPGITDRDLMVGQEAIMKKWLAHTEWQERVKMYEQFTGKRWGK